MLNTLQVNCPKCGAISPEKVIIYNESLRKQAFDISPILPTCAVCGSELEFPPPSAGGRIILLNGTCGSGKSATAEEIVRSHGYIAIDSDCVMQVVKHKLGAKKVAFDSDEFFEEISKEIDILLLFGKDIVFANVVLPADVDKYKQLFESKGLDYKIILLKPDYETAVQRCQTRTCHAKITPDEWIRYFYDRLYATDGVIELNNTGYSINDAVNKIMDLPFTIKNEVSI